MADYEVRIYQEETEGAPDDDGTTNSDVSPDPGDDENAGTPGPTDDLPEFEDLDGERAGTAAPEMTHAGTDGGQQGPQVDVNTDTDEITITSDHDLSPEEEVAALESASEQFTDASLTALHNLEDAEAGGDTGDIADARAQFKEMAKAMTLVDKSLSDQKEKLKRP